MAWPSHQASPEATLPKPANWSLNWLPKPANLSQKRLPKPANWICRFLHSIYKGLLCKNYYYVSKCRRARSGTNERGASLLGKRLGSEVRSLVGRCQPRLWPGVRPTGYAWGPALTWRCCRCPSCTSIAPSRSLFNTATQRLLNVQKTVQMLRDDGSCNHGFDPHTCPVGCGDVDNVNDSMVDSDGMPCGSCGGSEQVQCLRFL